MTLDLTLLLLVLFFSLWGALQGAARQVAHVVAGLGAWFAARPAGDFFGSLAAKVLHSSLVVGTVFATFITFVTVFLLGRAVLTLILQRILAGEDPQNRTADRVFGAVMGGAKISALIFVVVCALAFVEDNITIGGKQFTLVPKDSVTFHIAQDYNLFELSQFSGIKDVLRVARLQNDPKRAGRLKDNEDFSSLLKDPRFVSLLTSPDLKKSLGTGETRQLLGNNSVLELLQDPLAMGRISRIAALE